MTPAGCTTCGAALGSGQRYCLHCATPVAGAPHDLAGLHRALAFRATPPPSPPAAGTPGGLAAVARPGLALVAAGLLLGVLIGLSSGPPERVFAEAGRPYSVALPPGQRAVAVSTEPAPADNDADDEEPAGGAPAADPPAPEPNSVAPSDFLADSPAAVTEPVEPAADEPEGDTPADEDEEDDDEEPTAEPPKPPAFKHIFVVVLSELGYPDLYGPDSKAPFVTQDLVPKGTLLSGYKSVSEGGLANGIALVSGQDANAETRADCPIYRDITPGTLDPRTRQVEGEGCVYPPAALTVADQIKANGLAWRVYAEDQAAVPPGQPATCRRPALGARDDSATPRPGDAYATFRNPFVYFHSVIDTPACAESSVDLAALGTDLTDPARTPALSLVIPDRCRDGSQTACPEGGPRGAEAADGFLREWVPRITASAAFKDGGVLAIVADRPPRGAKEPQTGALVLSPTARPGVVVPAAYDHFSLLRTIQDGLNLPYLGKAEAATSFGIDVFRDGTGDEAATTTG